MTIRPRDHTHQPPALTPAYRSSQLRAPSHKPLRYAPSRTEATGPTFGHDLIGPTDHDLIINYARPGETAMGERIIVHGVLRDEDARPVPNALIEVWQANAGGRYRHKKDGYLAPLDPNFGGCGRMLTDGEGRFSFRTIRPGPYPWPNGGNDWRPAHIHFSIFGAAFAQRLITQMYFEGDPHIALCPIVQTIPDPGAIDRLTARLDMAHSVPMDIRAYRFDLVLRGRDQTLFENRMEGA
ncbi:protocatechuate 3,4-dioxygenase beta subunit [Rubricella aquisinus]|uniref:Protocatechuate 3,4-dioxygenase beta subunit n=1 Tax=Rubricella aquisinus TaxID=2028108 RepID=A0A840X5S3_9RHOB|nr:protocatechuate 3,4-dioxygenase subunit beta [Rubricella aquisinus]MBB5517126.1 protocatechuate 3,4-dioxygenase beta subunit [Rubricella aquisinus]